MNGKFVKKYKLKVKCLIVKSKYNKNKIIHIIIICPSKYIYILNKNFFLLKMLRYECEKIQPKHIKYSK